MTTNDGAQSDRSHGANGLYSLHLTEPPRKAA